jgi:hypothetical protein
MFAIIAAVAILAAVIGGVMAVRRKRSQAVINARLRTFCAR